MKHTYTPTVLFLTPEQKIQDVMDMCICKPNSKHEIIVCTDIVAGTDIDN